MFWERKYVLGKEICSGKGNNVPVNWRASEASYTLSVLFNRDTGIMLLGERSEPHTGVFKISFGR